MARQRATRIPKPHVWPRGAQALVMRQCIVEIDCIVIRHVQYKFEVNRCRNEKVNFQGSSANSVEGDSGQDGWTDSGDNHIIIHAIRPGLSGIVQAMKNVSRSDYATCKNLSINRGHVNILLVSRL
ncbi:hypothetical protein DPMN_057341 [Dreissena polymorpha]|uniref:Uncharacterized protein n=1 Tax=Dreissena polymorpha TaxID=45954 RepID=A0A9D4C016_DREPO|nr:hypothetical protein DPMN_057341 [Dreissena polymorpha]